MQRETYLQTPGSARKQVRSVGSVGNSTLFLSGLRDFGSHLCVPSLTPETAKNPEIAKLKSPN